MFRSKLGQRSDAQKREDAAFMEAVRRIRTLKAEDGRLSMDSIDLKDQLEALHETGKRIVRD